VVFVNHVIRFDRNNPAGVNECVDCFHWRVELPVLTVNQ
jgi:hypothetical protein